MSKSDAFEDLKRRIFNEEHPPGTWLVERDLSSHYGLSRTPIREVLRDLAAEGLLECEPAKGYRVKELRFEEIVDIFHTREAVEGMAARLACRKGDSGFFDELRRIKEALEAARIEDDVELGTMLGVRLHDCVMAAAGNDILAEVHEKLKNMSALTRNITRKFTSIEVDSKHGHIKLIEAVEKRDPDASERAMRDHLSNTCRRLAEDYMRAQLGGKS